MQHERVIPKAVKFSAVFSVALIWDKHANISSIILFKVVQEIFVG